MTGIARRTRAVARSRNETQVVDNYAVFLARIEEAQQSMREKLEQNKRRIAFLTTQFSHDDDSRSAWQRRVTSVNAAIEAYEGGTQGYDLLANALKTAQRMLGAYTSKTSSLNGAITQLKNQEAPLTAHINQLTAAKAKLRSAQAVEQSKGNMDRIVASTTSTALPELNVREDESLRAIRRLIAEAEALVELKG